ncbi:methyl-accepting chemotaxis protein [Thalassoglobus sp. JC818]|uniref:methyl-accepting chemotaxis protein n=1 Tax=Thalassoglobus sp. JC818 TaxID=3232136 RepID=UPI00345A7D5F
MTFRTRLYLTHLLSVSMAGILVWLLCSSPSLIEQLIYSSLLPVAAAVPAGMMAWALNSAIRKIEVCAEDNKPIGDVKSGVTELDELARHISSSVTWHREGWKEIERLLEQIAPNSSKNGSARAVTMDGRLLAQVLARMARAIGAEVGRILNHTNQISQKAHESAADSRKQAETVDEVIQCFEELSSNIDSILANAEGANQSATNASESADVGQQLIQQLIQGMNRISACVEAGERKIQSLGERSEEISSIVETMGTLSTRTDMLALNASIEAVRAGEQGRGFAVVAEEVRKLAEHTSNASREIADLIESIQMETQDTITTMAEERTLVQEEVVRVNDAGASLQEIKQTANESAEKVGEISRVTMDQLRGIQEMIISMRRVSTYSEEMHGRSVTIRQTTTDLIGVTKDLEQWISPMFHCDDSSYAASSRSGSTQSKSSDTSSAELLPAADFPERNLVEAGANGGAE